MLKNNTLRYIELVDHVFMVGNNRTYAIHVFDSAQKWVCHPFASFIPKLCLPFFVKGCILVLLKSHLRANRPNPNIIGLDGSCVRWMKTEDFIHALTVPSSMVRDI